MAHALDENAAINLESLAYTLWRQTRHRGNRQMGLFLALGLHALRAVEVERLRVRDLDPRTCTLQVHTAKGGNPRRVPLDPRLVRALLENNPPPLNTADWLLRTRTGRCLKHGDLSDRTSAWLKKNIGPYTFHSLRHTAAMRCWHATENILAVMRLLGHRSLHQTHTYLQSINPTPVAAGPTWPHRNPPQHLRVYRPTGLYPQPTT